MFRQWHAALAAQAAVLADLSERPTTETAVAFDWSVVPADMADLTADTLALLDQWSIEHFDNEVRSIARATLAAVIVNDRSVF